MWKIDRILDVFFQAKCAFCQRSTTEPICTYCARSVLACRAKTFQQTCDVTLLFSWGIYDDALKRAIAVCKYQGQPIVAEFLGKAMGEAWQGDREAQKLGKVTVVPIPLHSEKLKKRGFNQAEVLAKGFCDVTGMPCRPQLLQRVKNTKPQIDTKNAEERLTNLADAFAVTKVSIVHPVLLVDDIYTSGATIQEAIRALKAAAIPVVGTLVLSRTAMDGQSQYRSSRKA